VKVTLGDLRLDMRKECYEEIDPRLARQPKGESVAPMRGRARNLHSERQQLW
jgi:hypothetical protein